VWTPASPYARASLSGQAARSSEMNSAGPTAGASVACSVPQDSAPSSSPLQPSQIARPLQLYFLLEERKKRSLWHVICSVTRRGCDTKAVREENQRTESLFQRHISLYSRCDATPPGDTTWIERGAHVDDAHPE